MVDTSTKSHDSINVTYDHPIAKFKLANGEVSVESVHTAIESLAILDKINASNQNTVSSQKIPKVMFNAILCELKKPDYKDALIELNTLHTKKLIAEAVNEDTLIIQSINAVEELDKICNTLSKRLREWYSYYFPEMSRDIVDNELFVKKVIEYSKEQYIKEFKSQSSRSSMFISMGKDLEEKDIEMILSYARSVDAVFLERELTIQYIETMMKSYCPNLQFIAGTMIGAKLLEKAKSLRHLAFLPSSTIQMLGAEKALFRHLRNKKIRPPKHGFILQHPVVRDAKRSNRGNAARALASKISIAVRVDYFKGEFYADTLKKELDDAFRI